MNVEQSERPLRASAGGALPQPLEASLKEVDAIWELHGNGRYPVRSLMGLFKAPVKYIVRRILRSQQTHNLAVARLFHALTEEITALSWRVRSLEIQLQRPSREISGHRHIDKREKARLVESVPFWWHTIDMGDGVVTPGHVNKEWQASLMSAIPADLRGKKALDIGCWDGAFSFECAKRGAEVHAIDNRQMEAFVSSRYGITYDGLSGFMLARQLLGSSVRFREMDLYDLRRSAEQYDLVLLFGVLYHLKDPLSALEIVSSLTKGGLLLESHFIAEGDPTPVMRLYRGSELNNDPTNYWGPNIACIKAMLQAVGFQEARVLGRWNDRVLIQADKG